MSVVDSIMNFWTTISKWFSSFFQLLKSIFQGFVSVINYIIEIFKSIWYWLTSLIDWVKDLISEVFTWGVFDNVSNAFVYLTDYIWVPAVIFICTLFTVILFRIIVAFVFKLFRLNIDYHSLQSKNRTLNQHSKLK